ncbi:MAG: hypothetical protein CVU57_05285 [Deltaproteobacteria bacterium HGW-Deltaproteobacteria-15]|nr:MAG: hypothetical protein CVU57_05285 [Deltaproteobacteria bacterium HGW-Deltaproteobacteria-15]
MHSRTSVSKKIFQKFRDRVERDRLLCRTETISLAVYSFNRILIAVSSPSSRSLLMIEKESLLISSFWKSVSQKNGRSTSGRFSDVEEGVGAFCMVRLSLKVENRSVQ